MFKATISIEIQDNIEKKINVFNHYGVAIFTLFFLVRRCLWILMES